jgi:hypothetical protein
VCLQWSYQANKTGIQCSNDKVEGQDDLRVVSVADFVTLKFDKGADLIQRSWLLAILIVPKRNDTEAFERRKKAPLIYLVFVEFFEPS